MKLESRSLSGLLPCAAGCTLASLLAGACVDPTSGTRVGPMPDAAAQDAARTSDDASAAAQDAPAADASEASTPVDPCASNDTCGSCTPMAGCGWCGATGTCRSGTSTGPSAGECTMGWAWLPSECAAPRDAAVGSDAAALDAPQEASTLDARPDAPAAPDAGADAAPATFRSWSGTTANLRFLDGSVATSLFASSFCLYGVDSPEPFAVLTSVSTAPRATTTRRAVYGSVPAGIPLRVSRRSDVNPAATTPSTCVVSEAVPLNGGAALTSGRYYTGVDVRTLPSVYQCGTSTAGGTNACTFYPRSMPTTPAMGATVGISLLEDGRGAPGVRIVNATWTASLLRIAGLDGDGTIGIPQVGLGSLVNAGYHIPNSRGTVNVCPGYLPCNWTGTALALLNAEAGCLDRSLDPRFLLGTLNNTRLASTSQYTTVYVLGAPPWLAGPDAGLDRNSALSFVIANDVAD